MLDPNLRLWYSDFFLARVDLQLSFDPRGRHPGLQTPRMSPCNLFNFTPQNPDADNITSDIMDDERPSRQENRVSPFSCIITQR